MAIVPKPHLPPPSSWPNEETITNSTKIVINLACYFIKNSLIPAAAINFPLRCFSIYRTPNSKRNYKIPMEIVAFLILPFPHGMLLSASIDTISEVINFYKGQGAKGHSQNPLTLPDRLDATIPENACKILGLNPGEEKDRSKIDSNYQQILQGLETRKSKASTPIASALQELINDTKQAYLTLTSTN